VGDYNANNHVYDGNVAGIVSRCVSTECVGGRRYFSAESRLDRMDRAHPETGGATLDQNTDKPKQGKPTDATTGQGVTLHDESEAKDQPAVATGQDLKGRQFPPSKTPE
jgi:hypothetical protein